MSNTRTFKLEEEVLVTLDNGKQAKGIIEDSVWTTSGREYSVHTPYWSIQKWFKEKAIQSLSTTER